MSKVGPITTIKQSQNASTPTGYIGGNKSIGLTKAKVFTDGSWIIRKEDVTDL